MGGYMKQERLYQRDLIKKLRRLHPTWVIIKNDANYLQGIPDWTAFSPNGRYAWFDVKQYEGAKHQPNQDWYVNFALKSGNLGMFVYPENEKEFLHAIQSALGA